MLRSATLLSLLLVGAVPVNASPLADAVAETEQRLSYAETGEELCFPDIDGAAEAHVIYNYGGKDLVDSSLTAHPPRYADVRVEKTATPALLVLSAYEPTVWRIDRAAGATVAGVFLSGYYEQMVIGLDEGIPVGRTHSTYRNGQKKIPCHIEASATPEAESQDDLKSKLMILSQKTSRLNTVMKSLRETKIPAIDTKTSTLNELRDALVAAEVSEDAITVVDEKLEKTAEKSAQLRTEMNDLEQEYQTLRNESTELTKRFGQSYQGKRRSRGPLNGTSRFKTPNQLAALADALKERGDITVVSYQTRSKETKGFVVSAAQADTFRERIQEGKARLAALKTPELPLLPDDAPLMTAPGDLIAGDGIQYLVKRGYLKPSGPAREYYCGKAKALTLSHGFEPRGGCGLRGPKGTFTILGPITFPTGLCGGHSVAFLLPPGVAEPEGSPCHSQFVSIAESPCLEDASDCRSKRRKKNR